jgi:thioredoxin reductase
VSAVGGQGDGVSLRLEDGREVELDGLFTAPLAQLSSPLAGQLGCALEEGPLGSVIKTDAMKGTSIDGVYACGDAARMAGSLTFAVADGVQAGIAAHRSLMFGQV